MYATWRTGDHDHLFLNLDLAISHVRNEVIFSPACDPGVRDGNSLFIALHCLLQNLNEVLAAVEFTER